MSVTNEAGLPAFPQPVEPGPAVGEAATSFAADTSTTSECPDTVRALLDTAPLVISCEDESLWSIRGRLALPRQSAFIELLVYLGAARLQAPEPLDPWPGVAVDTLLDEVWTPRARDPQNRESGQTWLRKSLKRLQEEIATATGGLPGETVTGGQLLRLNPTTVDNHPDRTLFLCWPPPGDGMACRTLRRYFGEYFIYVGEESLADGVRGSTANDQLIELITDEWALVKRVSLPNWELCWDALHVFRRKNMGETACDGAVPSYQAAGSHQ